jgi:hypothetical protein
MAHVTLNGGATAAQFAGNALGFPAQRRQLERCGRDGDRFREVQLTIRRLLGDPTATLTVQDSTPGS